MDSDELRYRYSIDIFKLMYESRKSVENKVLLHLNSLLLTESFILAFLGIVIVNTEEINRFVLIPLLIALSLITISSLVIVRASILSKTVLPDLNLTNLKHTNILEEVINEINKSSLTMRTEIDNITKSLKIYKYLMITIIGLIFSAIIACIL
jgi:Na+/H+-translocating membrane pyrophosphatase